MYIVDQKDESFYTVSWACDADGTPLLVAGGKDGIIRVIDAGNEKIHKVNLGIFLFYFCSLQIATIVIVRGLHFGNIAIV